MSKLKTIYVDCQFFQTPAWHRGMGRYTLSLLRNTFRRNDPDLNVVMVFSSHLPKDPAMIAVIHEIFPTAEQVELDLKTTEKLSYASASDHNKKVLEAYLQSTGQDAAYLIPCHFQEPTATIFPDGPLKFVIYYDAIPFLYYLRYKDVINYQNYIARYQTIVSADTIFTISQTVADDLATYLGIEANQQRRIVNIDGACIDGMISNPRKPALTMPERYILAPSSDDIRKNNEAAIKALEQLRKLTKQDYKLVITSTFTKAHRVHLEQLSKHVVFTGNVDDQELTWLYEHSTAVLFASEYEGLGLPILEAVRMGKPVVCSNIAVFREISNDAFYFFDPLDTEDITLNLYEAIRGTNWKQKKARYEAINKRYTWERSAAIFIAELQDRLQTKLVVAPAKPKRRVAILAPMPQGYSAIGKVVQELHDNLSQFFEIDYYLEDRKNTSIKVRPHYLAGLANCYEVGEFNARRYADYDAVIYHIGNSEYHLETIKNALYLPGIVIAHDTMLTEAYGEMVRLKYMSAERLEIERSLDGLLGTTQTAFISSLMNNQLGIMVHSDYALHATQSIDVLKTHHAKANLPVVTPHQNVQEQHKRVIHVGFAGVLSGRRKGLDIIRELAMDTDTKDSVVVHMFGFNFLEQEVMDEITSLENVRIETDLSDLEYQSQLATLDILINYRSEYRGETSLTVLEAMRYGCVVVVNGELGWFSELPDEAVVKVTDQAELIQSVKQLIHEPATRKKIGNAAKKYTAAKHNPQDYAAQLAQLIETSLTTQGENLPRAQLLKTAKNISEVERGLAAVANNTRSGEEI